MGEFVLPGSRISHTAKVQPDAAEVYSVCYQLSQVLAALFSFKCPVIFRDAKLTFK